jgi:MFS family permease
MAAASLLVLGLAPPPPIGMVAALTFTGNLGGLIIGVMLDALIVEQVKYEGEDDAGSLQVNCWMSQTIGLMAGVLIGGWSLDFWGAEDQFMFALAGALKLLLIPPVALLFDPTVLTGAGGVKSEMWGKAGQVYRATKELRIWQNVVFIFIYYSWPTSSVAFNSFLVVCPNATEIFPCTSVEHGVDLGGGGGLGFSPSQFSYLDAAWCIGTVVGAHTIGPDLYGGIVLLFEKPFQVGILWAA